MTYELLLNKQVQVYLSPNKDQEGLKGKVVYEKSKKKGDYIVLLTNQNKYKLIEKGILKGENFMINLNCRNTNSLRRVKRRITTL